MGPSTSISAQRRPVHWTPIGWSRDMPNHPWAVVFCGKTLRNRANFSSPQSTLPAPDHAHAPETHTFAHRIIYNIYMQKQSIAPNPSMSTAFCSCASCILITLASMEVYRLVSHCCCMCSRFRSFPSIPLTY